MPQQPMAPVVDNNQANIQPQPAAPVAPVEVAPQVPVAPAPVDAAQPVQEAPQAIPQQPQPFQPVVPQQPVMEAQPQVTAAAPQPQSAQASIGQPQQAFGAGPVSPVAPAKRSSNKLILLIAAIVGGLAIIGVGIWAILTFVAGGVALETYEGKDYTVLVPKGYEKEDNGDTSVAFSEPNAEDDENGESTQSGVRLSSMSFESLTAYMSRDDIIKSYDETFTADKIEDLAGGTDSSAKNFKKSDEKYQGFDARRISYDAEKDGRPTGSVHMLIVFTEKTMYTVTVAAHVSDASLDRASNKILNSLKINE
jgi:hypothetical protein